jgi:hypothetical protein
MAGSGVGGFTPPIRGMQGDGMQAEGVFVRCSSYRTVSLN